MERKRLSNFLGFMTACFLMVFSMPATANDQAELIHYEISGARKAFLKVASQRLIISANCYEQEASEVGDFDISSLHCKAIEVIKNRPDIQVEILGGQNPGSIACEQLKGQVVFGTDRGNSITFCRFDDDSYIGSGSLTHYFFKQRREINSAKSAKPIKKKKNK